MKKENILQDIIYCVGDTAHDVIASEFDNSVRDTSFKTMSDYAPYGDTEVEVCQYITDEDEEEFRENWEKEMTIDAVINLLKDDEYFRGAIKDMVEHIAWNRTLEV